MSGSSGSEGLHLSSMSSSSGSEGSHSFGMSSSGSSGSIMGSAFGFEGSHASGVISSSESFKGSSSSDGKHFGLVGSDSCKMGTSGSSLGSGGSLGGSFFLGSKLSGSEGLHPSGMSDSLEVGGTSFGSKGLLGLGDSDGLHVSGMCKLFGSKGSHSLGVESSSSGKVGLVVSNLQLAGNDLVQLRAPVSDVGVAGTTPLETVMVTTGKVSSVVTLASEITSSTPKAVLVVVGHALDFSGGGTSHGSTESTVTFPGGGFLVVDGSSASMFDGRLAGAVLDNSTDGITESSVVTVLPSSGHSVRIFAVVSISDLTVAVALTSSSSSVFFTTMLV